ncbi:MAG: hypothetical protein WBG32_09480 [Nodosilinea sp.]
MPTTPSIHPPPTPPPQTQGHFSFNGDRSLVQAFYIVGFCKDSSTMKDNQGEKDGLVGVIDASVIGPLGEG